MPTQLEEPPWNEPLLDPKGMLSARWRPWFTRLAQLGQWGSERWITAERPTNDLYIGRHGFNTTTGALEAWDGNTWV